MGGYNESDSNNKQVKCGIIANYFPNHKNLIRVTGYVIAKWYHRI